MRNLLTNALDHGEGRPVRMTVAADSDAVAVLVRDHGVGLAPGQQDLVFTRFWRGDPSRDRRTGGTGLGLSISLEDARLHGGWLQAWGAPGQGSAFRLTLPRSRDIRLTGNPLPLGPDNLPGSSAAQELLTQHLAQGGPAQGGPVPDPPAPSTAVPAGPGRQ